jgi:type IV pilus assembly protein PilF
MMRFFRCVGLVALLASALAVAGTVPATEDQRATTAARLNAELAIGYLKVNDVTTAREKVEKALIENPKDATVHTAAALVYERLQERDRADSHYQSAIKLEPRNPDLQNNYAVFLCRNARPAEGQRMFEQAARNPAYVTPEVAFANAGVCARSAGDLTRADDYLQKALELRPDFPDALLQRADVAFTSGDGLTARASLQRYFRVAPATADALALGVRLERKFGDADTARRYARQLQQDFPDSVAAREIRAAEIP